MIITCVLCGTRYSPPPNTNEKYYTDCPDCRERDQHSAIDTDLLADLWCPWAEIEDWWE